MNSEFHPKKPAETNPISIISHKLRTPLTVIMSTVNNLLDGAFGKLNSEQTKWLKKLELHTTHLEQLLNDILNLLKVEPDKTKFVGKKLDDRQQRQLEKTSSTNVSPSSVQITSTVPTILIVDDEPDIIDVIQEGLASKGFQTLTASDGETAFKVALSAQPDLILMDVFMKNHNGREVCRKIKQALGSFTPVILVTGQDDLRQKITGSLH